MAEEKTSKEKAAAASCAGTPPRTKDEPLTVVTKEDLDRFVDIFNEEMIRTSAVIPTVDILTALAERQLRYLMQRYPMQKLEAMVEKGAASTFLNGGGRRGFRADIEWLTREQNFNNVVNGKYDDVPDDRRWRDPAEERQLLIEKRRKEEHERRLRNLEIEEEERERKRQQRDWDAAHAATPEQVEAILADIKMPWEEGGGGRSEE